MAAHPDYRENPARGIYICGPISEELVNRLIPRINELRFDGQDPLTVYIDSPGGQVACYRHLVNLIRAPDQDGRTHKFVTVAATEAMSAAAMLLSNGDYAIAYPNSEIMFHGNRISRDQALTTESASRLAEALRSINEDDALDLTDVMFPRLVYLHIFFRKEYSSIRETRKDTPTDCMCLAQLAQRNLRARNRAIVDRALKQMQELSFLRTHVDQAYEQESGLTPDSPFGQVEIYILRQILKFEESRNDLNNWSLSSGGLDQIRRDFTLLGSFFTKHSPAIRRKVSIYGEFFLNEEKRTELEKIGGENSREKFLMQHAYGQIEQLWIYGAMLAQELHAADCEFTPLEAFWLGLIDEVVGAGLPNKRLLIESKP